MTPLVPRLLLVVAASAVNASEVADALRYSSGSQEMRALSNAWTGRGDELLRALASTQVGERRGAAVLIGELGASCGIAAERLLTGLIACPDVDARRWAGRALLGRLGQLAPARLLDVGDVPLALRLLGDHPEPKALADAAVVSRLREWLEEPAYSESVAALIVQRGDMATWGRPLVESIAAAAKRKESGTATLMAAHQALCLLTRTQRGLASYAGHYDLLVADWNDVLAASTPRTTAIDPVVADAVGRLPDTAAVTLLLRAGPSALPAIEQAMAGADKRRRRELEPVARLVARAVSPALYAKLGDVGLAGIDAERPKERLAALTVVAAAVQEIADPTGILHLMTWLDDPDAGVRVAALDRLVRLSDAKKSFKGAWQLSEEGLFPPSQCRWRLRRCLTRGHVDEQVSAMQLVAGMSAKDLAADVAGLLLSPSPIVVETAIETLGHLDGGGQQVALMRVVSDRRQPTSRRIKVLDMIAKDVSNGSSSDLSATAAKQRLIDQLERLGTNGDDPAMRGPARKVQFSLVQVEVKRQALLKELLGGTPELQRAGLELLHHTSSDPWRYRIRSDNQSPFYLASTLPFLFDERPEFANLAASALVNQLDEEEGRGKVLALFPANSADRGRLVEWCKRSDRPWGDHLALGVALGLIEHDVALAALRTLPANNLRSMWSEVLRLSDDPLMVVRDLRSLQPVDGVVPDAVVYQGLRALQERILRSPRLLPLVLNAAAIDTLGSRPETDYGHNDRAMTKTFTFAAGKKLVIKGRQRPGSDRNSYSFDEETMLWTVEGAAPTTPDDAALDEVARLLVDLRVSDEYRTNRDLLVALIRGVPPSADLKIELDSDVDLWRIIATKHPEQRARIIRAFTKPTDQGGYALVKFLVSGDPDLLDAVMAHVRIADDEYDVRRFVPYLTSLKPEQVEPHLGTLLASKGGGTDEVKRLVKKIGRLPFAAALAAVAQGRIIEGRVMAYGEADLPALTKGLAALDPVVVLGGIAPLRALREAAPTVFDQAMREQASRQDATGAAWLRMGLPMQAGMRPLYDQALSATQPDVWLVGAAIALKEMRLDAAGFLERVGRLPAESLKDASLVTTRYLTGKLAGHEPALAGIIARAPGSALALWVPLLPPHELIANALRDRVRDPLVADQVGLSLAGLLSSDSAAWMPLVRNIASAAGGRLDYLLPRE